MKCDVDPKEGWLEAKGGREGAFNTWVGYDTHTHTYRTDRQVQLGIAPLEGEERGGHAG